MESSALTCIILRSCSEKDINAFDNLVDTCSAGEHCRNDPQSLVLDQWAYISAHSFLSRVSLYADRSNGYSTKNTHASRYDQLLWWHHCDSAPIVHIHLCAKLDISYFHLVPYIDLLYPTISDQQLVTQCAHSALSPTFANNSAAVKFFKHCATAAYNDAAFHNVIIEYPGRYIVVHYSRSFRHFHEWVAPDSSQRNRRRRHITWPCGPRRRCNGDIALPAPPIPTPSAPPIHTSCTPVGYLRHRGGDRRPEDSGRASTQSLKPPRCACLD